MKWILRTFFKVFHLSLAFWRLEIAHELRTLPEFWWIKSNLMPLWKICVKIPSLCVLIANLHTYLTLFTATGVAEQHTHRAAKCYNLANLYSNFDITVMPWLVLPEIMGKVFGTIALNSALEIVPFFEKFLKYKFEITKETPKSFWIYESFWCLLKLLLL